MTLPPEKIAELRYLIGHIVPQISEWDRTDHKKWPSSTFEQGNAFRNLLMGVARDVPSLLDDIERYRKALEEVVEREKTSHSAAALEMSRIASTALGDPQ